MDPRRYGAIVSPCCLAHPPGPYPICVIKSVQTSEAHAEYIEMNDSAYTQGEEGVSIVLCCHNSAKRLPETLAHLAKQRVNSDTRWEVLVIDNASTDATSQVARQCWPKQGPAPLRVVAEPRTGQANARLRGLSEARYEFLSFIDDDNWVCEDWVRLVASVMMRRPEVGILGGSSSPVFETDRPAWFHNFQILYAISPETWQRGDFTDNPGVIWGAGITVRKCAWRSIQAHGCPQLMSGRIKNSLAAGEDNELCYQFRLAGWKLWYEPSLHFRHYLPAGRLRWDYARRLSFGSGQASAKLQPYSMALDRLS